MCELHRTFFQALCASYEKQMLSFLPKHFCDLILHHQNLKVNLVTYRNLREKSTLPDQSKVQSVFILPSTLPTQRLYQTPCIDLNWQFNRTIILLSLCNEYKLELRAKRMSLVRKFK